MATLAEIMHVEATPPTEHWTVTDMSSAIWASQKLLDLHQQMAEIDVELAAAIAPLQARIDAAQEWAKEQKKDLQERSAFFEGHLTAWHAAQRDANPKLTSIKLPWATLASRKSAPGIAIADEDATLAALKTAGRAELVRVKEELNKSAIKDAVLKDGEILPGVTIKPETITFTVKLIDLKDGE